MEYADWKRKRQRLGALLMVLGVALVIVGSTLAWGTTAMLGFVVGSLGVLLIALGALMIRQAVAGPFPKGTTEAPDVGVDEE